MAPPPPPPALMVELIEEILLHIPPDEPAHLFRAVLVCKPWLRILTDPGFLRRYRTFHRAPPLLGYLHNAKRHRPGWDSPAGSPSVSATSTTPKGIDLAGIPLLAPTSAASLLTATQPQPEFMERASTHLVLDCRHGRVLIYKHDSEPHCLVVWNPITGSQNKLRLPRYNREYTFFFDRTREYTFAGAVLCAVDDCDHLDCHDGPFLVVFVGAYDEYYDFEGAYDEGYDFEGTWVSIYSSETEQWSPSISIHDSCKLKTKPTLLIGDTLYFMAHNKILKFDLGAQELSVIESPEGYLCQEIPMEVDGGGQGCLFVCYKYIDMLSLQDDAYDGTAEWAEDLVMELETLLPIDPLFSCHYELVGLLEGTNTVFIHVSHMGLFTLDLKSRKVKKVGKIGAYDAILPYTGFYTPDLLRAHAITYTKTQ